MYDYLWLNASLSNGGSERVMTLLANAFADRGLGSKMVLLREGKDKTFSTSPKLTVEQMTYRTHNRALLFLIRLFRIRQIYDRSGIKIVCSQINIVDFACLQELLEKADSSLVRLIFRQF